MRRFPFQCYRLTAGDPVEKSRSRSSPIRFSLFRQGFSDRPRFLYQTGHDRETRLPLDNAPIADFHDIDVDWRAYNACARRTAFAALSRQLLALIDDNTPRRFLDLAIEWELEALR